MSGHLLRWCPGCECWTGDPLLHDCDMMRARRLDLAENGGHRSMRRSELHAINERRAAKVRRERRRHGSAA